MSTGKKAKLSTGQEIPQVGYGTWQSEPGEAAAGVYEALKIGYRHLDFAKIYENQSEIKTGLEKAFKEIPGLKREDVFITSKLWNTQHLPELVEPALDDCLAELGLDYLDLYLIHWPVAFAKPSNVAGELFPLTGGNLPDGDIKFDDNVSIVDTWKAMTKLPKSKTKAIGVSNFTIEQLETIIKATGVVPAMNQIERHPLIRGDELLAYCKEKGILITCYSSFGNNSFGEPLLVNNPKIIEVAKKISERTGSTATPAQVLIAWAQVGGHMVIPKSVHAKRIAENFKEVELTPEDIAEVESIGAVQRRYNVPYAANKPRWDVNIFGDELEKGASHKVIL